MGAAIFLAELAPPKLSSSLTFVSDLLAAVPSVIYGLLGVFLLVPIMRTTVHQDAELFTRVKDSMPGRVTVRTSDGRELTAEVLYPKGNPGNPLTEDEFKTKYMSMAERVLGPDQAEELYQRARDLRRVGDVAELAPLFSPK